MASLVEKSLKTLPTISMVIAMFFVCNTQSYGRKQVVLTSRECKILPLTTENYLNATGMTFIYRGSVLDDCSVSFNTYHVKGDGICFNPLSWDVKSCTASVTLLFNENVYPVLEHTTLEDMEEWNCSSVPQMVCSNHSWARILVTANKTSSDNFQINAYVYGQKKFPTGYNNTNSEDDDKGDDGSDVHTYVVVAILVVAIIVCAVVMVVAIVIRKRRNREYSTTESTAE